MRWPQPVSSPVVTLMTLAVGALGAFAAALLSAPIYILLGPAIAVSLAGLSGMPAAMDTRLRDLCFLILGISVGAGFNQDALGAMLRWPLAFVFMALVLCVILVVSRLVLSRFFGFDRRSALLAGAPGHLSFVLAFAEDSGLDVARVSIVQSVRLLSLTLAVPFVAIAMGVDVAGQITPVGAPIALPALAGVVVASLGFWRLFAWLSVPAPLLLGAMVASALGHLTGLATGVLPGWLIQTAYLVLGALIGTRFSGVTPRLLMSGLGAGLVMTFIAVGLAAAGSVPVGWALEMPLAHVLVAFAPGGLETMIAMGVVLNVVPGFVAAVHIARLVVLSVLLPAMLGRAPAEPAAEGGKGRADPPLNP